MSSIATRLLRRVRRRIMGITPPPPRRVFDVFVDSHGESFELEEGYRDRVKPGWRTVLTPEVESREPALLAERRSSAVKSMEHTLRVLSAAGHTVSAGRALEIGYYDGHRAFALAAAGDFDVVAIDLPEYYAQESPDGSVSPERLEQASKRLVAFRGQMRREFIGNGADPRRLDRVEFVDASIDATPFPDDSFDLATSYNTLEHLRDPEASFREILRILKPGGVTFHAYNPFFSFNGGHALCTLDFPFGHARLSPNDFETYVRRYRPEEAEQDLRFYRFNLNRMTLADVSAIAGRVGLDVVSVIGWPDRKVLRDVDSRTVEQVRRHYPTATLQDLLCTGAWVILRKPHGRSRPQ